MLDVLRMSSYLHVFPYHEPLEHARRKAQSPKDLRYLHRSSKLRHSSSSPKLHNSPAASSSSPFLGIKRPT